MNKTLRKKLVVGGAIALGLTGVTTSIATTSKNITLQKTLQKTKKELDTHKKENDKTLKIIESEKEELQNSLDEALKELEKTIEERDEVEAKISQIKKQTGVTDFKKVTEVTWEVTYYTDLPQENSYEYGGVNATGEPLEKGMVANNNLPLGTKIYVEGYGLKTVEDRGSDRHFSQLNRIDIFVPRVNGETDSEYYTRVNNLGRDKLKGYIFEF